MRNSDIAARVGTVLKHMAAGGDVVINSHRYTIDPDNGQVRMVVLVNDGEYLSGTDHLTLNAFINWCMCLKEAEFAAIAANNALRRHQEITNEREGRGQYRTARGPARHLKSNLDEEKLATVLQELSLKRGGEEDDQDRGNQDKV